MKNTKEKIIEALENKNEIIVNDVEDGDTIKYYHIDLEVNGKEISVSIEETERNNPQITEITNVEFNEFSEKLPNKLKKEIERWLFNNSESWRGI